MSHPAWPSPASPRHSQLLPGPPVQAVVTPSKANHQGLIFQRCSQESRAVTFPTRNLINAAAEGKAVINPEIQVLEEK